MSVTTLPGWRTLGELSQATGLSTWTLRREIEAGRLKVRRIGRCLRVLDDDSAAWMRGQNDNGPASPAGHVVTSPTSSSPDGYVDVDII